MYPTKDQIENIADWPLTDLRGLLEHMQKLWNNDFGKVEVIGNEYHFITGGWSRNEDIIDAARENGFFWGICWEKSERGGLHVFKLRATS